MTKETKADAAKDPRAVLEFDPCAALKTWGGKDVTIQEPPPAEAVKKWRTDVARWQAGDKQADPPAQPEGAERPFLVGEMLLRALRPYVTADSAMQYRCFRVGLLIQEGMDEKKMVKIGQVLVGALHTAWDWFLGQVAEGKVPADTMVYGQVAEIIGKAGE